MTYHIYVDQVSIHGAHLKFKLCIAVQCNIAGGHERYGPVRVPDMRLVSVQKTNQRQLFPVHFINGDDDATRSRQFAAELRCKGDLRR